MPWAAEQRDAVAQAERALAEMRARDAARADHEAETQSARVIHWHSRDQAGHAESHTDDSAMTDVR